jgi:hypothetical protein
MTLNDELRDIAGRLEAAYQETHLSPSIPGLLATLPLEDWG